MSTLYNSVWVLQLSNFHLGFATSVRIALVLQRAVSVDLPSLVCNLRAHIARVAAGSERSPPTVDSSVGAFSVCCKFHGEEPLRFRYMLSIRIVVE